MLTNVIFQMLIDVLFTFLPNYAFDELMETEPLLELLCGLFIVNWGILSEFWTIYCCSYQTLAAFGN